MFNFIGGLQSENLKKYFKILYDLREIFSNLVGIKLDRNNMKICFKQLLAVKTFSKCQ